MKSSHLKVELWDWTKAIFIALVLAWVVKTFIFAPYTVKGESMEPTLHDHERIAVNKITQTEKLKHGDIVIIKGSGKTNYVKRIIGFPGDTVEVDNDKLLINGKQVKEPYLKENMEEAKNSGGLLTGDMGPIVIPEKHYFVMGDNRRMSMDSRNGLGLISQDRLVGRSELVFFPFSSLRSVK
ncbi:signal peptidase I [Mesobacillus zeae]|uniref:Signal peptidase I n=1 Tax=Mesobacillus zeae TaxID=1917180 RepID=A0A398B7N0_9BACI|nr:signal peptidase I [Mesobacillus zeae]RID85862.1 signal peptidase I [Mesobacillus zeae]